MGMHPSGAQVVLFVTLNQERKVVGGSGDSASEPS